jgi:type VI secretion system protein VasD
VVRAYELKIDGAFKADHFFTMMDKDQTVLADDLATRDQFQLRLGEHPTIGRRDDRSTTTLGILAPYRDPPNYGWRAVYALPITPGNAVVSLPGAEAETGQHA